MSDNRERAVMGSEKIPSRWRLKVDQFGWNKSSVFINLFIPLTGLIENLQCDLGLRG